MRPITCIAAALMLAALPAAAQRPGGRVAAPAQRADTGSKPGAALDFQDQDIHVVLSALAEAGHVNLTYFNLPTRKVTLRMGTAASSAEIEEMIKGIAEANDLTVTKSGSLIQVAGPAPEPPVSRQQQQAQLSAQNELRLYTYRLKHASATQLAPVLLSLFSGTSTSSGRGATANTPGVTIFTPGGGNGAAGGGGGGGRGGRGGGGGGTTANDQSANAAAPVTLFGGRGGNALAALQAIQQASLSSASADVRIVGEETSNSLLVRATASDWQLIQEVVQGIDVRPLQVLIEVTIAEVQRSHDLNVGLSGGGTHTSGRNADSANFPSAAGARDFILKLTGGGGSVDYNVALNALQERGDVRVLSLPVIIAQNNREAVLNVGEQRPFVQVAQSVVTGTVPTTVQTIQYLDVGTVLTITPTINPDGYVNLQVDQTDNSATNEVEFNAPVISKREAQTQVFLRDGQTTVIGGLSGKTTSHTVSGIPILSKIPIIGGLLFGNTQKSTVTSELFLFLTPHVISQDEDIDKLREAVKSGSELLKQVPTDARIIPATDTIHVPLDSVRRQLDSTRARHGGGGGE